MCVELCLEAKISSSCSDCSCLFIFNLKRPILCLQCLHNDMCSKYFSSHARLSQGRSFWIADHGF